MSRRVYLGRLPPGVQKADVEDHFKDFPTQDIRLMGTFGFVEFQSSRPFLGENLIVEPTRDARRRDVYDAVIGISSATSWQDLKDYGRLGGNNIIYADVDRNNPSNGILSMTDPASSTVDLETMTIADLLLVTTMIVGLPLLVTTSAVTMATTVATIVTVAVTVLPLVQVTTDPTGGTTTGDVTMIVSLLETLLETHLVANATVDPFSAASKPLIPVDSLPSRPLEFAATIYHDDVDTPTGSLSVYNKLPRPKRQKEPTPAVFPSPQYSHTRQVSEASIAFNGHALEGSSGSKHGQVGDDNWMQAQVANGHGLTKLSTKISDLRDLVTLPSTYSPQARLAPSRPPAPYYPNLSPAPGLPTNGRSFSRVSSAPAASSFFSTLQPRSNRAASGLAALSHTPASPTATETSEDGENSITSSRVLLASPSLPSPSTGTLGDQRQRSFGRSKTGAVSFESSKARDLGIYAGQNNLTSLRGNQLTTLPAAIGELSNLKELNIGNNLIVLRTASSLYTYRKDRTTSNPFPWSHRAAEPDDASLNRYYYPCPSPRHLELDRHCAVQPTRHIFLHPAEERIEWREVFKVSGLPVRWLGCSPGCLAHLENEEEEEWTLDD
ncbi:hypothetical protein IAR55_005474 [Kwoniella newhampshirensis]|uniref:RRM domain-containing protein n=1 Tax=Kwoniella newhampshirensis TaxID=1651941 RepID=A0AAW0YWC0_9TREE